jgi:hypothetical protein
VSAISLLAVSPAGWFYAAFALCELCARPRPWASSSSDSFLVITVSSWTRFDKTSISLRVGTLKTLRARNSRSGPTSDWPK